MAYDECESAVLTLLRSLTGVFPSSAQVSTDSAVLDSGVTNCAVVYPGEIGNGKVGGPVYQRAWGILLSIYTQLFDETTALTAFKTLRAAVVLVIDRNPNLGGVAGVDDTVIVSSGKPYVSKPPENSNGSIYFAQDFVITVYQDLTVT